jgi:hypothetical protein
MNRSPFLFITNYDQQPTFGINAIRQLPRTELSAKCEVFTVVELCV